MILRIATMLIFAATGCSALGLNFATVNASDAYRRSLSFLSGANLIAVALIYFESTETLLMAGALPGASLLYAIVITITERVGAMRTQQRREITRSRSFRTISCLCLLGLLCLSIALRQRKWDFKPVTPIADAVEQSQQLEPGPAEQADRSVWDRLKNANP